MSQYVSIPPYSTGKKIRHTRRLALFINSTLINLQDLQYGDLISNDTNGSTAVLSGWDNDVEEGITLLVEKVIGTFNVGDTISSVEYGTIGVIVSFKELYTPNVHISDADNPYNTQKIDDDGASYIRFKGGNASLDTFGNLLTSELTVMKAFSFIYDNVFANDFNNRLISGGTYTNEASESHINLATTSSSGSLVQTTTKLYFPYMPLQSNIGVISMGLGDNGKSGVVRRWGFFDDEDGCYFELNGSDFTVNIKSSISNTVNSVMQENFNGTKLLFDIIDPFVLDFSKYNLFWISYQWHGVGVAKFGVFDLNGEKLLLHTFRHPNTQLYPYMKRGTMPYRIEQFNTTDTASPSILKVSNIVVARESSKVDFVGMEKTLVTPSPITVTQTLVPLASSRPPYLVGGLVNRVSVMPTVLHINSTTEPIYLVYILNGTLTGESFVSSGHLTENDTSATAISGGTVVEYGMIEKGTTRIKVDNSKFNHIINNGLDGQVNQLTLAARTIAPGTTTDLSIVVRYLEII
jgi:hypothetical protein